MVNLVTLIVLTLAATRLTRLAREDKITDPLRSFIVDKTGAASWLSYLFHCHWCLSVWAAAAVTAAHIAFPDNRLVTGGIVALAVAEAALRLYEWQPRTTEGH